MAQHEAKGAGGKGEIGSELQRTRQASGGGGRQLNPRCAWGLHCFRQVNQRPASNRRAGKCTGHAGPFLLLQVTSCRLPTHRQCSSPTPTRPHPCYPSLQTPCSRPLWPPARQLRTAPETPPTRFAAQPGTTAAGEGLDRAPLQQQPPPRRRPPAQRRCLAKPAVKPIMHASFPS